MKVVQVSTYRSGGAGTAAWRLHHALRTMQGLESIYSSLDESMPTVGRLAIPKHYPRWYHRILDRFGLSTIESQRQRRESSKLELSGSFFSFPRSDIRLDGVLAPLEVDLIHLHWVPGIMDWPTFFARCGKPVIWTLHDMNAFMGGFHYTCDRDRAGEAALREDAKILRQKRDALATVQNLVLVAPSRWMAQEASNSELMGKFPCRVIPNGLDTAVFRPFPKELSRSVLQLPEDARLLLTVAEDLRSHRKGADILAGALEDSPLPQGWELVTAGSGQVALPEYPVRSLGSIGDDRLLALLYSAVDLVVLPTRQDNLPNVALEAIACGTPVVANRVGGLPEIIHSGQNGLLAEGVESGSLAAALRQATRMDFDRHAIRADAVARFDHGVMAQRHKEMYLTLLQAD